MRDPDAVISSERLTMPILSRRQLADLGRSDGARTAAELEVTLSDEWVAEVTRLAALRAAQLVQRPEDGPWLLRPIVRADTREAIGHLNFHRAPDERGMVEIGYALLPDARGNGYAIEAVRTAFEWAQGRGARFLRASVAPDNARSINLINKLGLVLVGEQWDEIDGRELVYERSAWTDGSG